MAEQGLTVETPVENGDVQMAEIGPNGHTKRSRESTPLASIPAESSSTAVDSQSYATPNDYIQEDDGSVPPPAKRARTFSDADQASMVRVSLFLFSCAITGVLIPHIYRFLSSASKVCNPTSSLSHIHFHQYHSNKWHFNPHPFSCHRCSYWRWTSHAQHCPISLLPIDSPHAQKIQGRHTLHPPR